MMAPVPMRSFRVIALLWGGTVLGLAPAAGVRGLVRVT